MWFKKETKIVDYSDINSTVSNLQQTYRTNIVLRPRYIDQNHKVKIIAWIYLSIPEYIITIEEYYNEE